MKQIDEILSRATGEMLCTVNEAMTIEFCVEFVARGIRDGGFFSESMKKAIITNAGSRIINELNNLVKE